MITCKEMRGCLLLTGFLMAIGDRIDKLLYRDQQELLETAVLPLDERFRIVEQLGKVLRRGCYHSDFLRKLAPMVNTARERRGSQVVSICEIGPGSGAMLRSIHAWASAQGLSVGLYGIDLDPDFGALAQRTLAADGISVSISQGDATRLEAIVDNQFDIVIANNMVHHIRNLDAVARFFREVARVSNVGWLIVDLDRRLRGIPFMISGFLLGGSPMLVIDGVRSVRRAYHRDEISNLIERNTATHGTDRMDCVRHPILPYWWVKGTKSPLGPR